MLRPNTNPTDSIITGKCQMKSVQFWIGSNRVIESKGKNNVFLILFIDLNSPDTRNLSNYLTAFGDPCIY